MEALPPLARVARYGDVRQTRADRVLPVIDGLFERVLAGLPGACASLDDDAANAMVDGLANVQECIGLLDRANQRQEWQALLHALIDREAVHGLVRGWSCRLLLEARILDEDALQRLARLALSPVTPPAQASAWVEGVLRGSALLLLHQDGLWAALDRWLTDLDPDTFIATLPLLRRAFSSFQPPERRNMADKAKRLSRAGSESSRPGGPATAPATLNRERADAVLPVLARILGVPPESIGEHP
jgi:hypothetical protein